MLGGDDKLLQGARALPVDVSLQPGETLDAVYRGELLLIQRRDGYRFSVDPLLLAAFVGTVRGKAVDLGTGCGIIPLLLARRGASSVIGVELQVPLFQLAYRNVQLNRCEDRIHLVQADLRQLRGVLPPESYDLVTSNPPYIPSNSGNLNPAPEKALARHELTCSVPDLADAARYLLRWGGSVKVVFPASRLAELMGGLNARGLKPKRMRLVFPVPSRPARLVLLEAVKGGGEMLECLPPLFLYDEAGAASPECQKLLSDANACLDRPRGQG